MPSGCVCAAASLFLAGLQAEFASVVESWNQAQVRPLPPPPSSSPVPLNLPSLSALPSPPRLSPFFPTLLSCPLVFFLSPHPPSPPPLDSRSLSSDVQASGPFAGERASMLKIILDHQLSGVTSPTGGKGAGKRTHRFQSLADFTHVAQAAARPPSPSKAPFSSLKHVTHAPLSPPAPPSPAPTRAKPASPTCVLFPAVCVCLCVS